MIKKPINNNYCATVVEIKNIIPIENCDNVVHTNIFGNSIIVSKDVKVGDIGLFFPLETKLSNEFLKCNNLYRKQELNIDQTKKGYFEENGRIRCVKFRGNKSEGFFIPLNCIYNIFMDSGKLDLNWKKIGTEFDELNDIKICEKYIPKQFNLPSQGNGKQRNKNLVKKFNVLIDNQFRLHSDTSQLGKSIHRIKQDDIISITTKLHGTSGVSSLILCKRKLNLLEKFLIKLGIKIQDTEYKNIWSSRKVIKNQYVYPKNEKIKHFYSEDIWSLANNRLKDYLQKGLTFYYEIVGYLPYSSGYIQKGYDYGCKEKEFDIYIYRITYTNTDGKVFEWSMYQIQEFCKMNRLKAVPLLYYGYAKNLFNISFLRSFDEEEDREEWQRHFLNKLKEEYLEKDSELNIKPMPEEGIVVRIEKNDLESYKLKSFRFFEYSTKLNDENYIDIEDIN